MAATLILTRQVNGIDLWRFRFDVTVDGECVGPLERGKMIETPVEPGQHTLRRVRAAAAVPHGGSRDSYRAARR